MNRQRKEQMKAYLHNHFPHMRLSQQHYFMTLFAPRLDMPENEVIDRLTGKMLRRAHTHVQYVLKKERK